jgi:hypothetical protein
MEAPLILNLYRIRQLARQAELARRASDERTLINCLNEITSTVDKMVEDEDSEGTFEADVLRRRKQGR